MAIKTKDYTFELIWSEDDEEFVGRCLEFPLLSHLDKSEVRALQGIMKLIEDVLQDLANDGVEAPVPLRLRDYSGDVRLRLSPEKHKRAAIEAARRGVSMNKFIESRI